MIKKKVFLFISIFTVTTLAVIACSSSTSSSSSSSSYYSSYIEDKVYTLSQIKEQNNINYSFAFITDLHIEYNEKKSPTLLKEINKQYTLDKVVLGGDYISNDYEDVETAKSLMKECIDPFSSFNYTAIVGNHDSNNNSKVGTPEIPDAEVYSIINNCQAEYPYSLEKNDDKKICLFYLNSGTSAGSFSDEKQKQFLYDGLMNLDSSWSALIFIHIIFDGAYENNNQSVIQKVGLELTDFISTFFEQLSCSVVGVFSGHSHLDYMDVNTYSCPIVTTMCDALGVYNPNYNIYRREKGKVTEQAFDIVQVDTENHKVFLTRIGGGSDRYYSY